MYLLPHFITSIILTVIAWPFLGFHSLWIIVGGFLIDTDHYIFSIFKKKNFNIKDSYIYYKTKQYLKEHKAWEILHIFHTIEFLILMIILSIVTKNLFLQKMFSITFLGMVFHLLLDLYDGIKYKKLDRRAFSVIQWIYIIRKNKSQ